MLILPARPTAELSDHRSIGDAFAPVTAVISTGSVAVCFIVAGSIRANLPTANNRSPVDDAACRFDWLSPSRTTWSPCFNLWTLLNSSREVAIGRYRPQHSRERVITGASGQGPDNRWQIGGTRLPVELNQQPTNSEALRTHSGAIQYPGQRAETAAARVGNRNTGHEMSDAQPAQPSQCPRPPHPEGNQRRLR